MSRSFSAAAIVLLTLGTLAGGCGQSERQSGPIREPSGAAPVERPPVDQAHRITTERDSARRPGEAREDSKFRIRLKRDAKGGYSWEINSSNLGQIIETDRKLRKRFGKCDTPK